MSKALQLILVAAVAGGSFVGAGCTGVDTSLLDFDAGGDGSDAGGGGRRDGGGGGDVDAGSGGGGDDAGGGGGDDAGGGGGDDAGNTGEVDAGGPVGRDAGPGGCEGPSACDDGVACTVNECRSPSGPGPAMCVFTPIDEDDDGYVIAMPSAGCGDDCNDSQREVNPGQMMFFGRPTSTGDFDYNCDGRDERQVTALAGVCRSEDGGRCAGSGWLGGEAPGCGEMGYFQACHRTAGTSICTASTDSAQQLCR